MNTLVRWVLELRAESLFLPFPVFCSSPWEPCESNEMVWGPVLLWVLVPLGPPQSFHLTPPSHVPPTAFIWAFHDLSLVPSVSNVSFPLLIIPTTIYFWSLTFLLPFLLILPYKLLACDILAIRQNLLCGNVSSFACKMAAFYLRDGVLKTALSLKYSSVKLILSNDGRYLCLPAKVALPCGSHNVNRAHSACQFWKFCDSWTKILIQGICIISYYIHESQTSFIF